MKKHFLCCILLCIAWLYSFESAGQSGRLSVSENGRYLVSANGEPFFWLADTAWELFHRCSLEEIDVYLKKRKEQGFNVIQAVALAELDGIRTLNAAGLLPLLNEDPETPNPEYFNFIEKVLDMAREHDMYIALLPTWGDKLFEESWGVGPEIFNETNAGAYGKWLGERFREKDNLIWIIGGDRNPRNEKDIAVWNQMAYGIVSGAGGFEKTLMTFHPQPKANGGSSTWYHNEEWLDFNMHQTGHCPNKGTYIHISHDYALSPIKPVLDGEPLYEEHPNCFNAAELGYSEAGNIRRIMYWNIFAGAFGQTYGCHDVWQMYSQGKTPVNGPLRPWTNALDLPMANQVKHLKNLMLSRPLLSRVPDNSIVTEGPRDEMNKVLATRDSNGSYAMVYFPDGNAATLNLDDLRNENLTTWWYDPRTGNAYTGPELTRNSRIAIQSAN